MTFREPRLWPSPASKGTLYPPLRDIRRISLASATSVAECVYQMKFARARRPRSLSEAIARVMYEP